jgi:hypothetical protein
MRNPAGMPTKLAMSVEVELTFRETPMIWSSSGFREPMSNMADEKLSAKKSIIPVGWA